MPLRTARPTADFAASIRSLQDVFAKFPAFAAVEAKNFYVDSFRRQGYIDSGFKKWPRRKSDGKKDSGRAILVKSGALRRAIRHRLSGNVVTVYVDGTAAQYAQVHNEGGDVKAVQSVRAHTRNTQKGKVKVKAHSRTLDYKMPQRQFMDIPGRPMSVVLEKRLVLHLARALERFVV